MTEPTGLGTNTLSCKVDGAIWRPAVSPLHFTLQDLSAGISKGGRFYIYGLKLKGYYNDNDESLDFSCDTANGIGQKMIRDVIFRRNSVPYYGFVLDSSEIQITTLDTTTKVISGRFSFLLYNDAGEKVTITDGRFDIRWH